MSSVGLDVDAHDAKALAVGLRIVQPPRNEFYGQRRFLALDHGGYLVDVCSPWHEDEQ